VFDPDPRIQKNLKRFATPMQPTARVCCAKIPCADRSGRLDSREMPGSESRSERDTMTTIGSITECLHRLKTGDDAAAQVVWDRYFARLVGLAHRVGSCHAVVSPWLPFGQGRNRRLAKAGRTGHRHSQVERDGSIRANHGPERYSAAQAKITVRQVPLILCIYRAS
jgi:hypothetical protein